ncbi:MAG: oligosaccharide flippase family protein [Pseudomonadota bacterium]
MKALATRLMTAAGINPGSRSERAIYGTAWTFGGYAGGLVIRLAGTVILTRILAPEDFGLLNLAMALLAGVSLLSDVGIQTSIVRTSRADDPAFMHTAWTIQVIRGFAVAVLVVILAKPMADLYGEALLWPLLSAIALIPLVQGFQSVGLSLAQREVRLRPLTLFSMTGFALTQTITIIIVWQLVSVWGLVIGGILGAVLQVTLSHLWLPYRRPVWQLERPAVREIMVFGGWVLLASGFQFLGGDGRKAVLGFMLPLEILGIFGIAEMLSRAPSDFCGAVGRRVLFPSISELMRERPQAVRAALFRAQVVIIGAFLPGFLLLALIAQDLVDLVYDDRYAEAGAFLTFLALYSGFLVLEMPYAEAILSKTKGASYALLIGVTASCRIAALVIGFQLGGVYGAIHGIGAAAAISHLVSLALAYRGGFANPWLDLLGVTLIGGGLAVALSAT